MPSSSKGRFALVIACCLGLIVVAFYVSLSNGTFEMSVKDVFAALLRIKPKPDLDLVIFEFRLPRIIIAILVGAGLGIAGAVIQSVARNGLADSGVLGINAGAGMATVMFLFFFQSAVKRTGWGAILAMPLFGLAGGFFAALLIFAFAWKHGRLDPQRLLLTGIAIGTGLSAVSLYLTLKMNAQDFEMVAVWTSGSIYNANWKFVVSMLPWFVALLPVIIRKSRILDVFRLEEASVRSVGVHVGKERTILLLSSIGLVSACVSVSGGVSFVGLMSPHIARRLVGDKHFRTIPVCGLVGALLVLMSDFIGRVLVAPMEIPVGIVVAIIGVPYFIYLLYRQKHQR